MIIYSGSRVIASGTMSILACRPEVLYLLSLIIAQANLRITPYRHIWKCNALLRIVSTF